jgi:tetratricopeptide (TPR) repeat protein
VRRDPSSEQPRWRELRRGRHLRRAVLVALPFLLSGIAGLLQDTPSLAILLLFVGTAIVVLDQLQGRAREKAQARADHAVRMTPGLAAGVDASGTDNLPALARNFTGRDSELAELERLLKTGEQMGIVACHGLGGVGKTQLALAYAHHQRASTSVRWWIRADRRLTAVSDLVALASALGLTFLDDGDQEQTAIRAVAALAQRSGWLLVYDNAPNPADLQRLLPVSGKGQVLITSRNPNFDAIANTVEVNPLPEQDAAAFLLARTKSTPDARPAAQDLAAALAGLPLALEQASAYCVASGIGLADYVNRYQRDESRLLRLGIPGNYSVSVAVTWLLNFRQAARADPAAAQLLRLLAFMAPGEIPRDLVTTEPRLLPRALAAAARDPVRLDWTIGVLRGMSLVSIDRPGEIRIHQLVQQVLRDQLRHTTRPWPRRLNRWTLGRLGVTALTGIDRTAAWPPKRWADVAAVLIARAFSVAENSTDWRSRYRELLPHGLAALAHAEQLHVDSRFSALLQHQLAHYLGDYGDNAAARDLLQKAVETRRRIFGPDHRNTLASINNLAVVLKELGEFEAAHELLEQAQDALGQTLGREHSLTLSSINNLAALLYDQGQFDAACELLEHVLDVSRRKLGPENPDTLSSMNNLATALYARGDTQAARELLEHALEASRRILGPDHPTTLGSMHNLAMVLQGQGDTRAAHELLEDNLDASRQMLGPEHPATLVSIANLAGFLHEQGDPHRAHELLQFALETSRRILGAEHPTTLGSMHGLAIVLQGQGEFLAARELLEQAVDISRRVLGPSHPTTLLFTNNLAELLRQEQEFNDRSDLADERSANRSSSAVDEASAE